MMASSVMEIVPLVPFVMVVDDREKSPLRLPKGPVDGLALPAPTRLAQPSTREY